MGEVPEVCLSSRDERSTRSRRADDRRIEELNGSADEGTTFKVIWLARHGQGVHNVVCPLHLLPHILLPLSCSLVPLLLVGGMETDEQAEEKYGTRAWNRKWSLLEGDGELVWVSLFSLLLSFLLLLPFPPNSSLPSFFDPFYLGIMPRRMLIPGSGPTPH
jgi:hypothetical protein